jgi:hypothetical protein
MAKKQDLDDVFDLDYDNTASYSGNPMLKPAGVQIQLTHEQQLEMAMCQEDIIYFVKNYVKIVSLDEGIVPFNMWGFQEKMITTMKENRFTIAKLPRQVGKTTTTAALILWYIIFEKQFRVAILANKFEQSQEILERVQMAYENLPKWMQQGVHIWNKRRIVLENGSQILASATSSSAIRGKSINLVYLDEFAHIERNLQQKFYTSTYPVITSGKKTKVIMTSTPNGFDLFAKFWYDAMKEPGEPGKNEYVPFEAHWSEVPGRDEQWRINTINNTSAEQFRQEFETNFIGSSSTLISAEALQRLFFMKPIQQSGKINIYEEPNPEGRYFITVDVARGGGGDYSAFVIVDTSRFPYKVVCTYRDNLVAPHVFPNFIAQAAKKYNNAQILVEINDIGGQVAQLLNDELEVENLLYCTSTGRKGWVLGGGFGKGGRPGVKTTPPVKRMGCFNLKHLIESNQLLVQSEDIVQELYSYVEDGNTYNAEVGKHDDFVMCLVLFSWATTQIYFKELLDSSVRDRMMEIKANEIEEDMLPLGFLDDGRSLEEVITNLPDNYRGDFERAFSDWGW